VYQHSSEGLSIPLRLCERSSLGLTSCLAFFNA
jgi:hypothetical protein